jgi:hypothetical protein
MTDLVRTLAGWLAAADLDAEDGGIGGLILAVIVVIGIVIAAIIALLIPGD